MIKKGDYGYKADKGKHFVLTEIGKTWASYKNKTVGEPIDEDDRWASSSMVENGAVVEVDDPDWITMPGFRVVYDVYGDGKYIFDTCNFAVYPSKKIAEAVAREFNNRPWRLKEDNKAFVIDAIYEGKRLKPCGKYNGKKVINRDWLYWDAMNVGDYVTQEVADDICNALPPACMRSDCLQLGEPQFPKKEGFTYLTLKKVDEDVWEFCGYCLRGQNVESGTPIPYVV